MFRNIGYPIGCIIKDKIYTWDKITIIDQSEITTIAEEGLYLVPATGTYCLYYDGHNLFHPMQYIFEWGKEPQIFSSPKTQLRI